jgi:hypothetical protein
MPSRHTLTPHPGDRYVQRIVDDHTERRVGDGLLPPNPAECVKCEGPADIVLSFATWDAGWCWPCRTRAAETR